MMPHQARDVGVVLHYENCGSHRVIVWEPRAERRFCVGRGCPPGRGRDPSPHNYERTKRSMAWAKPSSWLEAATNLAAFFTSSLALPIAMLMPLFRNMRTSLGPSPMVAILSGGIFSISESTVTTSPLLAWGWVTSR